MDDVLEQLSVDLEGCRISQSGIRFCFEFAVCVLGIPVPHKKGLRDSRGVGAQRGCKLFLWGIQLMYKSARDQSVIISAHMRSSIEEMVVKMSGEQVC